MKKKKVMAMLLACCLAAAPAGVYGADSSGAAEETQEEAAAAEEASALSDQLYDFQIEIMGEVYQFPMSYADFTGKGWELKNEEDAEERLRSNSYGWVSFQKGDLEVSADVLNLQINECAVKDSLIAGISISGGNSDIDLGALGITLAKGITMGQSNLDDIKAAYGEPTDTYEGDLYTKVSYEKDIYEDVELYVYKDDNTLKEVSVRNLSEPEGFDKGAVSGETPEIVTAYTAPAEPGTEMMDPVVEFCGDLYTLPCPITAFEANGWKLDGVSEEDYVEGNGIDFVDIIRDTQSVSVSVYNLTENAVSHENCFVTELSAANYDGGNISLTISGGYTLGAEKADMIAAAEEKGYPYEENDSYLTIYKDEENKLDTRIELWFDSDESETAVASITYRNEVLE